MLLDAGQQIIVAEPLSSAANGSLFAARPLFPGGKLDGSTDVVPGELAAGHLVGAGPFFLDLKGSSGGGGGTVRLKSGCNAAQ
eukprot:SAG31_NODE_35_length_31836_cov_10.841352_33_plen_83_part_00